MPNQRITKLTPQQGELLNQVRDEWLNHGLNTQPADRITAEQGVRLAYQAAGLEPPGIVIWLGSPMGGAIGQGILRSLKFPSVWDQVGAQVWDQVRDQVWDQVGAQVGDQVGAQVRAQVRDQVRDQVWDQVRDQVRDYYNGLIYGQHWADWCAWIDTMQRIGVKNLEPFEGHLMIGRSAGWWWAFRGAVILTERPQQLHRDPQGRLHHPTEMAIRYPDGWGFHAWHGTRMPAGLYQDEPSLEQILKQPNSEIRRCAIEMTGWDKLEHQLGAPVATAPDPGNPGRQLALYDVPDGLYEEPVRLVLMTNGSPDRNGAERRYGETVPADISDPLTAQAWAYGVPRATYAALTRRT